jgi:poly-gamma-glutamate capsule biosynthesis protein CapA/YwtB (metallophosphatase superfamily)
MKRLRISLFAAALALLSSGCGCSDDAAEEALEGPAVPATEPAASPPAGETKAEHVPEGGAPEPRAERFVLLAGGDVNFGRGCGRQILAEPSYDPFRVVRPLLETADLRFVNLESQLSDQNGETQSKGNMLVFTGPPGGADVLSRAGIDLVSLANNHAWDYGKPALLETFENLERVGVAYAGAHREPNRAYEPTIVRKQGWSVALFAVTQIWNQGAIETHPGRHHVAWAAFEKLREGLQRARREHDLVLVSYHGGSEYVNTPMSWTRDFVRAVMRAGADAVLGHHPHVPQGVGWFGDRPAFYSLGNLVFPMHSDHPWTGTSFFARLTFSQDRKLLVEACPYHIHGHTPMLFEGKTKAARDRSFAHHLKLISISVGGTKLGEPGEHSCVPLEPPEQRGRP